MRTCTLAMCLVFMVCAPGCGKDTKFPTPDTYTGINGSVERAGRNASGWSLRRAGALSPGVAKAVAQALRSGCNSGVAFLQSPGAAKTAEMVNKYLVDCILKNLNPLVAAGIDTGASILDDILDVPAGQMLTQAELATIAAFVKGIAEGCDDYLSGWTPKSEPPVMTSKSMKPRTWLHLPPKGA